MEVKVAEIFMEIPHSRSVPVTAALLLESSRTHKPVASREINCDRGLAGENVPVYGAVPSAILTLAVSLMIVPKKFAPV